MECTAWQAKSKPLGKTGRRPPVGEYENDGNGKLEVADGWQREFKSCNLEFKKKNYEYKGMMKEEKYELIHIIRIESKELQKDEASEGH